jgi:hypothetical protein
MNHSVWTATAYDSAGGIAFRASFLHNPHATPAQARATAATIFHPCKGIGGCFAANAEVSLVADDLPEAAAKELYLAQPFVPWGLPRGDQSYI